MLRSVDKQSGESVESVLEKKRKALYGVKGNDDHECTLRKDLVWLLR